MCNLLHQNQFYIPHNIRKNIFLSFQTLTLILLTFRSNLVAILKESGRIFPLISSLQLQYREC